MSSLSDPQLKTALSVYTAALPRHARLIQLAGEVLRQLALVKAGLPPVQESEKKAVEDRLAAGQPILAQVPIPAAIFQDFLNRLLELFQDNELLPLLPDQLYENILALPPHVWLEEASALAATCEGQNISEGLLFFLGQKALAPFYQHAAAPYLPRFLKQECDTGKCPFCGQEPALASLAADSGQKFLYCSLCAVQWPFPRQTCAFCGNSEPRFSYIFVEDDPARRADLCQVCGRYLKTIVINRLPHGLYIPLEEFVTVDLDALLARDHSKARKMFKISSTK